MLDAEAIVLVSQSVKSILKKSYPVSPSKLGGWNFFSSRDASPSSRVNGMRGINSKKIYPKNSLFHVQCVCVNIVPPKNDTHKMFSLSSSSSSRLKRNKRVERANRGLALISS